MQIKNITHGESLYVDNESQSLLKKANFTKAVEENLLKLNKSKQDIKSLSNELKVAKEIK